MNEALNAAFIGESVGMTTQEQVEEMLASYPPAVSTPLRILIVDDEEAFAGLVARQFRDLQVAFPRAQIEIVRDWPSAIRAVDCEPPPHLVLLDLKMPGPDGEPDLDLKDAVKKAIEFDQRSAVVIITGHRSEDVEGLLVDSQIEVLQKNSSLWMPNNIIRACIRALERKNLAEEKGRFSKLRGILGELKSRYASTPETQPL